MNTTVAAVLLGLLIPLAHTGGTPVCGHRYSLLTTCIRGSHPATAAVILRAANTYADPMSHAPERRVRFLHPDLQVAAAHGTRRSPTFARLMRALEASDLIVQVQFRPDRRPSGGARLLLGPATPSDRFVRIQSEPSLGRDKLIAQIGHELFHAVEVAAAPEVRSEPALAALYRKIGYRLAGGERFDTSEAHVVEAIIRRELLTPACRAEE
jgi:hypothetical protein